MKKIGIMNAPISAVVAGMFHTDMVTIADAGLPVPMGTACIDLTVKPGVPALLDTLEVVLSELHIEKAYVSAEIMTASPARFEEIKKMLGDVPIEKLPHVEFKKLTASTKAIVRTADFTPYSNVILVAGAWGFNV